MKAASKGNDPFAYFITIRTYATWLHGDERERVVSNASWFSARIRSARRYVGIYIAEMPTRKRY